MNKIDRCFEICKEDGRKAFIPFFTAGDPNLGFTRELILAVEAMGADAIELGVPFSDPVAEGPAVQEASLRAINAGATLGKIFDMVGELRRESAIPIILQLYVNCIFKMGIDNFFSKCKELAIDGVLIPDLPFEEQEPYAAAAHAHGVYLIRFIAPSSHKRIQMIAESAEGFLYCMSTTGVAGVRDTFATDFKAFFEEVNKFSNVPCCIGFGISNRIQASELTEYCDGAIVDSDLVETIHNAYCDGGEEGAICALRTLVTDIKAGL